MPQPIGRSAVGIGLEDTPGTAVAAGMWLPSTTMNPTETVPQLLDQSMRGSAAKTYGSQPGPRSVSYALAGNLIPDVIGWPLVGILGADAVTGSAAPYSHAISLLNSGDFQPPSYSLVDINGIEAITYAGCRFSDLELTFSAADLAKYTATAVGSQAASSGSLPATSYSTLPPLAAWRTAIIIGGGAADPRETDLTLTFKRTVDPIFALADSQDAYDIFAGGDLEVTGKMTGVFEVTTLRDDYRAGTETSLDVTITNGGAGAAACSLNLHCTAISLSKADVTRGKQYVELDCEFTAIANPTDKGASGGLSPVAATLSNAVAAGEYAAA